jgi:luciferase-type oxidoreductase
MTTTGPCELSDADPRLLPGYRRTFVDGRLTLGLGFPVETGRGEVPRMDVDEQLALSRAAEDGGVAALWARDIPLRVPSFGDVGQIHDPWVFLTWVAAHTSRIALGTAADLATWSGCRTGRTIAASLDRLSGGRFLLGVASGDRPEEFRAFGLEQGERGERFREHLRVMTHALTTEMRGIRWPGGWMHSADVVPKPTASSIPLVITGSAQQSMRHNAEHGDAWLTYPREFTAQRRTVEQWRALVAGTGGEAAKPFAQSLRVDLAEDPDETASPLNFGFRIGRHHLVEHLRDLEGIGVNHVLLGLSSRRRSAAEVLDELVEHVVPHFPAGGS